MKLIRLEIQNYRSLFVGDDRKQLTLDLADGMNCIVGQNNCGKSNVFRALAVALDPEFRFDRKQDMPAQWLLAKPTITLTFKVGKKPTSSEKTLLKHLEAYEREVNPNGRTTYAANGELRYRVTIDTGNDSAGSRRETFMSAGAGARTLPADHDLSMKVLAQFKKCFHFVFIESGQSLTSLLEGKFRDILRSVLREHLGVPYAKVEKDRLAYQKGIQTDLLHPLTKRVSAELKDLFPEVHEVELRPEVGSLDDSLTRMSVVVTDSVATDLSNKGTGVRGGIIVSILRHLAEEGKRSMLFAVEEPEAFLHPGAQESLRDDLEALSKRDDVSLLVATHSPFVVSRAHDSKVFSLAKDPKGRTYLHAECSGTDPKANVLGNLFQNRVLVDVLDRSLGIPDTARAILVVEGYTDEQYLRLADSLLGGPSRLQDIAIVLAGAGVPGNTGGAALVVMQAILAQGTSALPVIALLDNDAEGNAAVDQLRKISSKTGAWSRKKNLLQYGDVFASGVQFAFEAEDLWPNYLVESFVASLGEDAVLDGKVKRPNPVAGWQFSIKASAKTAYLEHLRAHATASDVAQWSALLDLIRTGARLNA